VGRELSARARRCGRTRPGDGGNGPAAAWELAEPADPLPTNTAASATDRQLHSKKLITGRSIVREAQSHTSRALESPGYRQLSGET